MLIELKDVKKYFAANKGFSLGRREMVRAVDGVSLSLEKGENLALVGESGCGKTTLGRIILKLISVDSGQIIFNGRDISRLRGRQMRLLRKDVQMVFQDPFTSMDPRFTVRDIILEAMVFDESRTRQEKQDRAAQLLSAVKLNPGMLTRYPHEFSGGERQRIAIARALAMNPQLLILDEAVSSLDVLVQEEILQLLKELQQKFHLTYLFISHNLRVVRRISQRVAVMYRGKIVELGPVEEIFRNPLHPYTKDLLSAALQYRAQADPAVVEFTENSSLIDKGNGHWVMV